MSAERPTMTEIEREIEGQPGAWREAASLAGAVARTLPPDGVRAVAIGCGTSYYMAQAYAGLRESLGRGETDAFPASEMPAGRRYDAVVAISRSGTTTEVIRALRSQLAHIPSVALTAIHGSPVTDAADASVVLDFADERSIVQTRFATTALALLRAHLGQDVHALADDADLALSAPLAADPMDVDQFVFLGRGWTVGLAGEAALKLREAGAAWSESYPAMEFRHGPVSVIGSRSLVWGIGAVEPDVLAVAREAGAHVVQSALDPMAELIGAQRLAVALARAKGLDPDRPKHLSRSVVLPWSQTADAG